MGKDRIKIIKLSYFRGATKPLQIDFDPSKSMTMIFGENGTGKSTLVDALDFIFNRDCSLKEKSSTNIRSHLPALGFKPNDVKVFIESKKGMIWEGKLNGSKPEIKGSNNILSVGVLRRDKVLKLNAQPTKRYEALKDFIELPNIRSSEKSLRELIRDIERQLDQNIQNKGSKEEDLQQVWEKEGKKGESFLSWVEEISKKQDEELKKKISKYEKFIELIKKPLKYLEELGKLKANFTESEQTLNTAENHLKELCSKNQPEEIIDILQKTQSFLQKEKMAKECPACEQAIVPEDLQKRISDRLKNMTELAEAAKQHNKAKQDYEFAEKTLSQKEKDLRASTEALIKQSEKEEISESKKITESFAKNNFLANSQVDIKKAEDFFKAIQAVLTDLENTHETDTKELNQLNLIKSSYSSLKKTESKIHELDIKNQYLSEVHKIVESERKAYVEDLLNNISKDIEYLYSKLHPKEGLNNIELFLKPHVQASLEIKSDFQNKKDVPPQAYFSDSHLDALGICVFIATAKYFKNDIIVLDDVVTSLDQQHLDRFIKLLHDENQNFSQIIITTHYRPWRERYKFYRQENSNIKLIELSAFWSLDKGIKSSQTKLSIEELETLKNQELFDRQAIGSKTGVFLESLLDNLSLLYELYVPRRSEPRYTLGELMNCFSRKFIEKMKIEKDSGEKIPFSRMMDDLFQIAEPIRNQVGSHFNTSGMDISDKEIMSFLDQTIALAKTLICRQCGGWPQQKSQDGWKCSCGKTKLYPEHK